MATLHQKTKKDLEMLIQHFFPHIDLKVCFTNNFKISSLFKSKDVMPVELRSNLFINSSVEFAKILTSATTLRQHDFDGVNIWVFHLELNYH